MLQISFCRTTGGEEYIYTRVLIYLYISILSGIKEGEGLRTKRYSSSKMTFKGKSGGKKRKQRNAMQNLDSTEDKWLCIKMTGSGQWIRVSFSSRSKGF